MMSLIYIEMYSHRTSCFILRCFNNTFAINLTHVVICLKVNTEGEIWKVVQRKTPSPRDAGHGTFMENTAFTPYLVAFEH